MAKQVTKQEAIPVAKFPAPAQSLAARSGDARDPLGTIGRLAVTREAELAAKALARLEDAAAEIHAAETTRRGFQAVSSPNGFQALIRHGKTIVEIQNDSFAVRQLDD
jgi:hypothetical protein